MVRPKRKSQSYYNQYRYRMIKTVTDGRKTYKMEHRLVLEDHLGRPLARDERVKHLNGDRRDNRLENLQLIKIGDNRLSKEHLIKSTLFTKDRAKVYDYIPMFYNVFNNKKEAKSL